MPKVSCSRRYSNRAEVQSSTTNFDCPAGRDNLGASLLRFAILTGQFFCLSRIAVRSKFTAIPKDYQSHSRVGSPEDEYKPVPDRKNGFKQASGGYPSICLSLSIAKGGRGVMQRIGDTLLNLSHSTCGL